MTRRYSRLVAQLGINTRLKELRYYSATELLTAGVDLRAVAGGLVMAVAPRLCGATPPGLEPPTTWQRRRSTRGCRSCRASEPPVRRMESIGSGDESSRPDEHGDRVYAMAFPIVRVDHSDAVRAGLRDLLPVHVETTYDSYRDLLTLPKHL